MRVSRSNLKRVALPSFHTGLLRKNSVGLESRFYSAALESRSGLSVVSGQLCRLASPTIFHLPFIPGSQTSFSSQPLKF